MVRLYYVCLLLFALSHQLKLFRNICKMISVSFLIKSPEIQSRSRIWSRKRWTRQLCKDAGAEAIRAMSLIGDADPEPVAIVKTKTWTRTRFSQTIFQISFFLSAFFSSSFFFFLFDSSLTPSLTLTIVQIH